MASEAKERSFKAELSMSNGDHMEFTKAHLGQTENDKEGFLCASTNVSEPLNVYFRCEGDLGYLIAVDRTTDDDAQPVATGLSDASADSLDKRIEELQRVDPLGNASPGGGAGALSAAAELPESVRDLLGNGSSNAKATPESNSVVTKRYFGVDASGRVFRASKLEEAAYFKIFGRDKTIANAITAPQLVYLQSTKSSEFIHVDSLALGSGSESGGTLIKLTVKERYNSDGSVNMHQ